VPAAASKHGITAADVAREMGFTTHNAVYRWLNGEALPSLDNLVILAGMLDVRMDDIVITRAV
jgi:transcriptional regulator with XRE-family HTH domain